MNRPRKPGSTLPPCVYFKHGAYYYVKRGKWERIGQTLSEALAQYVARIETPAGGMAKLIDDAMPYVTRGKAASTKAQYEGAAKVLKRKLAEFSPEQVKAKHVAAIKRSLAETPNMGNRIITVLRLVFDYAVEEQIIDANPCVGIRRHEEKRRTRLLTPDEWTAIHAAAGPRLRIIMELQYYTGQRIVDVLKISRAQLTEEGVEFRQQKTGKKLLVEWFPELRATVEAAKALSAEKPAVTLLRGKYGKPPNYKTVYRQWAEAAEKAGVKDAKLNDGRAMSATHLRRQGGDPQALLGHSSPRMTDRYLRDRETPKVSGPKRGKSA